MGAIILKYRLKSGVTQADFEQWVRTVDQPAMRGLTRVQAFNTYRGTGWMPEPCKSCEFKEVDFGGCRCQAHALTGSAGNTDPACAKSPLHAEIFARAATEAAEGQDRFIYRNFSGGTAEDEVS